MSIEDKLNSLDKFGITLGLDSIAQVLQLLDNPQDNLNIIHIAGTNGKGSTLSIIEETLIMNNMSVCKYTSPYLDKVNEMFVYNKQQIDDHMINTNLEIVTEVCKSNKISLSRYEVTTVIMLLIAAQLQPDFLLLETGLGGRLDATNVVNAKYTLITNVSYDHMQYLGNTLEEIAIEKAGIANDIVYVGRLTPPLLAALGDRTIISTNQIEHRYQLNNKNFTTSIWVDGIEYKLNLYGTHQVENFLLAYQLLLDIGVDISVIELAVTQVEWEGRVTILRRDPLIIYDGAHNTDACRVLVESFKGRKFKLYYSTFKDKDFIANFKVLSKLATEIIYVEQVDERGLTYDEFVNHTHVKATKIEGAKLASIILEETSPCLVCGTLNLYKYIKKAHTVRY